MAELSDETHEHIQSLCQKGDVLAKKGQYPAALQQYWAAWDLLPAPQTDWVAATWILAAIGDANFLGGDFTAGRDNLRWRCIAPMQSAILSCTCDWAYASSSWGIWTERRTNSLARTWALGPKSSKVRTGISRS